MKITYLIAAMLVAVAGCSSSTASNPLQIVPAREDWEAAFSKLSPREQALVKDTPVSFGVSEPIVDGSIYHMTGRGPTNEIIKYDRLNIAAICEGFNHSFGLGSTSRWEIVKALSYEQIGAPSGVQIHRFELKWTFRDSKGRMVTTSATEFGPGVKIIWGASREAIDAEINQALALTFLKLVVQLERRDEPTRQPVCGK